jgi:hypothetical protein
MGKEKPKVVSNTPINVGPPKVVGEGVVPTTPIGVVKVQKTSRGELENLTTKLLKKLADMKEDEIGKRLRNLSDEDLNSLLNSLNKLVKMPNPLPHLREEKKT